MDIRLKRKLDSLELYLKGLGTVVEYDEGFKGSDKVGLYCSACGERYETLFVTAVRMQREGRIPLCSKCLNEKIREGNRLGLDVVLKKMRDLGYQVKEGVKYKNQESLIDCVCPECGSDFSVTYLRVRDRRKDPRCPDCLVAAGNEQKLLGGEDVQEMLSQVGAVYVGRDEDRNVLFRCALDGCDNIGKVAITNLHQKLKRYKNRQPIYCDEHKYLNVLRGESHPNYNVNLSEEDRNSGRYGRGNMFRQWSHFVLALYGFKGVDGGDKDLVAHHIIPWAVDESQRFNVLNAVPLSKEFHKRFHSLYRGNEGYDSLRSFMLLEGKDVGLLDRIYSLSQTLKIELVEYGEDILKRKREEESRGFEYIPLYGVDLIQSERWLVSFFRVKLGLGVQRVYARETDVYLPLSDEVLKFHRDNHRQGEVRGISVSLGLKDKEGKLCQVLSFGKSRFVKGEWELLRNTVRLDTVVVGGFSRLLSHLDQIGITSFLTYADVRFGSLDEKKTVYSRVGLEYVRMSDPGYFYYDGERVFSRFSFQKSKLGDLYRSGKIDRYDSEWTESRVAEENDLMKVLDCGNHVFVWNGLHKEEIEDSFSEVEVDIRSDWILNNVEKRLWEMGLKLLGYDKTEKFTESSFVTFGCRMCGEPVTRKWKRIRDMESKSRSEGHRFYTDCCETCSKIARGMRRGLGNV